MVIARWVRTILLIVTLAFVAGPALAAQTVCQLSPGFQLLKNYNPLNTGRDTSWQITYEGRQVYNFTEGELKNIFGGYPDHGGNPPTNCVGLVVSPTAFALIVGWQGDLMEAFGIEKNASGELTGVKRLQFYVRDYAMSTSANGNEIIVNFGWKHDLWARLCWSPNGDKQWWHNQNHRFDNRGPCVSATWPWPGQPGYDTRVSEIVFK